MNLTNISDCATCLVRLLEGKITVEENNGNTMEASLFLAAGSSSAGAAVPVANITVIELPSFESEYLLPIDDCMVCKTELRKYGLLLTVE